ncbi:uncharacterized protein RCO7_00973 [Rhynchosporium graminicola]|uniref:Uncharacterized protein n=1 Tax=Rhynchosporium graminicola TaxID=2792576 RepID=A0A1E1JUU3_9HELO|nr:uncharacterized protein RCO7_00973 [Rhynchosporium commune]
MAKAPTTAADFDGSGDTWFKIRDIEPTFPGGVWDLKRNSYPNLRCHVRKLLSQEAAVKTWVLRWIFLGAFKATDSGYTANIYNNFTSYTIPGPEITSCYIFELLHNF